MSRCAERKRRHRLPVIDTEATLAGIVIIDDEMHPIRSRAFATFTDGSHADPICALTRVNGVPLAEWNRR